MSERREGNSLPFRCDHFFLWLTTNRRTGITLKEGRLDEHGMEEIDGMFSSPEKSPVKTNGGGINDTMLNSEDMDTGGSELRVSALPLTG
jgi:centromere protein C